MLRRQDDESTTPKKLVDAIIRELGECAGKPPDKEAQEAWDRDARGVVLATIALANSKTFPAFSVRPRPHRPHINKTVAKHWSAEQAFTLFRLFSGERPTIFPLGPFYGVAQRLHEAISGQPDADMTNACRSVLRANKEELQDRWG